MTSPLAVCLSPLAWGGLWTSRHEICSELARRGWDVLFVDPPENMVRRAFATRRTTTKTSGSIRVVTPPPYAPYGVVTTVPWVGSRVLSLNARRYARSVSRQLGRTFPGRPVDLLINSFMPVIGYEVQSRIGPRVTVYHRADELRQFSDEAPLADLERRVASEADVVTCVTERVREGIAGVRPDAVVVPNGVDTDPYHRDLAPDPEVAALPRPVSVIIGVFDRRVDPALLEAAASVSTLVMVGRVDGIDPPAGAICMGHVDQTAIPPILVAADVGVVCYVPNLPGDALKIYQYLAAGLPVVTSHDPMLPSVRDEVAIATDPASFALAVKQAVAERTTEGDVSRRAVAEKHTWSRRVDQILELAGFTEKRSV